MGAAIDLSLIIIVQRCRQQQGFSVAQESLQLTSGGKALDVVAVKLPAAFHRVENSNAGLFFNISNRRHLFYGER